MKFDCGFTKESDWFRYRTGAIITNNDKILFVKSKYGDYYYMVGGGVHLGETSVDSIEREVLEEIGIPAKADYLSVICENFFKGHGGKIDGLDCHTIELYFRMNITDEQQKICKEQTDDGELLVWIDICEVEKSVIKPTFIKERILEILNNKNIIHIIEERDR